MFSAESGGYLISSQHLAAGGDYLLQYRFRISRVNYRLQLMGWRSFIITRVPKMMRMVAPWQVHRWLQSITRRENGFVAVSQ